MTIMDATLLIVVLGVMVLALGVDLAALVGWLRRRWPPRVSHKVSNGASTSRDGCRRVSIFPASNNPA